MGLKNLGIMGKRKDSLRHKPSLLTFIIDTKIFYKLFVTQVSSGEEEKRRGRRKSGTDLRKVEMIQKTSKV